MWHETSAGVEEITFDICDQYMIQAEEFSLAVINDTPVTTPLEDAVANMRVIEAVVESGRSAKWVEMAD
jgi:predicted dehydrogenase